MHLIARLYDAEGVEIETLDGPAEDIARRIGEFALLHGADPDGAGEAARPGRIEFEPYKGRDDDTPVIGTAVFQGEAWVNDHASPVDDSRYAYPITEAEYAEAWRFREVQAFDSLQEAAAAPRAVKGWPGPFSISVSFGARKPAVAAFIEAGEYETPEFDADEVSATMGLLNLSDEAWDNLDSAEQAVLIDAACR